jgi:hypothetical protein
MRKPPDKKVPHTFRLSQHTLDGLRDAAQRDLRSLNNSVEVALREWLAARMQEPRRTAG